MTLDAPRASSEVMHRLKDKLITSKLIVFV